jgi:hypothetical protein
MTWVVATAKKIEVSNVFFFSLFEEGKTSPDANSIYFNITSGAPPSSTRSSTTASAQETHTRSTLTTVIAGTASTSTAAQTSAESSANDASIPQSQPSGLSTGAKAGIAVGVIGGIAFAICAAVVFYRRSRAAPEAPLDTSEATHDSHVHPPDVAHQESRWGTPIPVHAPSPGTGQREYDPSLAYKSPGGNFPAGQEMHEVSGTPLYDRPYVHELPSN